MTNNDDFDQSDFNTTEEIAGPRGMRSNLAEAWRSRPLFKLVVLMTAVAAIVAASVSFFSGGTPTSTNSRLPTPPSINAAPGGPSSPYMQEQTGLANANREQQAMQSGGSALPTPIGKTTDMSALNSIEKKNDPLNDLRLEVERLRDENRKTNQQQIQQQQQVQVRQQEQQFDDTLAQAMQRQMSQLMEGWQARPGKLVTVADVNTRNNTANGTTVVGQGTDAAASSAATQASNAQVRAKTIVPAGTVNYGQLLTEANSDVPGPILASIASGPLAGARAVGQFQIANGYADYLVLQFNLVNFKGKDYQISAIALDPDTTLGGMATEVDQRYFTRVILPAAAGFLQGFGQALGQGSSTTTTNGTSTIISQSSQGYRQGMFRGLNAAANTASQFFQNQANQVKPLVRVAAGTPIGIFFITSVLDNTAYQQQHPPYNPAMAYGYPGAGALGGLGGLGGLAGYPGIGAAPSLTGSAYPGTTVAGFGSSSGVPYPNYANPSVPDNYGNAYGASPYSALPSGLGTTYYGR